MKGLESASIAVLICFHNTRQKNISNFGISVVRSELGIGVAREPVDKCISCAKDGGW